MEAEQASAGAVKDSLNQDNGSRESRKPSALAATIKILAFISVLICTVLITILSKPSRSESEPPYEIININNGGLLAYDNKQIYYVGGFGAKRPAIIASDFEINEKRLILHDEGCDISLLFLSGKTLYFVKRTGSFESFAICAVDTDGQNERTIVEKREHWIKRLTIRDNKLYYLYGMDLFCYDLSEKTEEVLIKDEYIVDYVLYENSIYYSTLERIKCLSLDTRTAEILAEDPWAISLTAYNGYLYFCRYINEGLYRIKLTGGRVEYLAGEHVAQYIMHKDKIYFIDKLDDTTKRIIFNNKHEDFYYSDIELQMINSFGVDLEAGVVFQINMDGTGMSIIETNALFSHSLFCTPRSTYVTRSFENEPELMEE